MKNLISIPMKLIYFQKTILQVGTFNHYTCNNNKKVEENLQQQQQQQQKWWKAC